MQIPTIGRVVHYTSYGSPGGEYKSECRAAVITGISGEDRDMDTVHLAVLNPTGMFFNTDTPYCHETGSVGGTWHWPEMVAVLA